MFFVWSIFASLSFCLTFCVGLYILDKTDTSPSLDRLSSPIRWTRNSAYLLNLCAHWNCCLCLVTPRTVGYPKSHLCPETDKIEANLSSGNWKSWVLDVWIDSFSLQGEAGRCSLSSITLHWARESSLHFHSDYTFFQTLLFLSVSPKGLENARSFQFSKIWVLDRGYSFSGVSQEEELRKLSTCLFKLLGDCQLHRLIKISRLKPELQATHRKFGPLDILYNLSTEKLIAGVYCWSDPVGGIMGGLTRPFKTTALFFCKQSWISKC